MSKTLDYYNENAQKYIDSTVSVDFTKTQDKFLACLKPGASILDFGCGSGRDTKYFMEHGYKVDALDGSEEFCKYASAYTGIEVKQMLFQDFKEIDKYDGIWACSSILHLTYDELVEVMKHLGEALHHGGIMYTSFKYSDFEGYRHERYFIDFKEEKLKKLIEEVGCFEVIEQWITGDVRVGRGDERWLNILVKKI